MQAEQRRPPRTSSILPLLLLASPSTAFLRSGSKKDNDTNGRHLRNAVKWWYHLNPSLPGGGECVENADYPDDWLSDFPKLLYTSYDECCDNHDDVSCILNVEKEEMWYNLNDSCIFGSDYPHWMGAGLNKWSHLFDSEEDCCQVYTCKDKEPKWWPKDNSEGAGFDCVFGNDYPVEFLDLGDNYLFDTRESCCADFCGDAVTTTTTTEATTTTTVAATTTVITTTGTTTAATTTTTSNEAGSLCTHAKWHISTHNGESNTCTNDNLYPEIWNGTVYLQDSAEGCCDQFFDAKCVIKDVCQNPHEGSSAHCPERKWHVSTLKGGANTCTNDPFYPIAWDTPEHEHHLWDTAQECCDNYFLSDCKVHDNCPCSTSWHLSISPGQVATCTNDLTYPKSWEKMAYKFFFPTKELCCLENFDHEYCAARDVCQKCIDTWHVNPDKPSSSCSNGNDAPPFWPSHMTGYESAEACCKGYYGEGNLCDIIDMCDPESETPVMQSSSIGLDDETHSPTYNPTFAPDDDDGTLPVFPMWSGPCSSDSQCLEGLVCDADSRKCICNEETNEGCYDGAICGVDPHLFCPETGCLPSCHCDVNNDVGGTNGCKSGQVCRLPCAIADSGPMCFDNDHKRDCFDGLICRVDRDGHIGGACVEEREVIDDIIPNLEGAGCAKGYCEDFDGQCKQEVSCFVDPCDMMNCGDGGECVSNVCGGCNGKCIDSGMTENSATLPATHDDCPRGECHNPDGTCEVEMFCAVDPCNGHPCEFGQVCQTNMCGGCHAVCAPDPSYVEPVEPVSGVSGVGSKSSTSPTMSPVSTPPTVTPGVKCPHAKWHVSTVPGGAYTCTNDDQFPPTWFNIDGHLFESASECCDDKLFGDACIIEDVCHSLDSNCPEMRWHMSTLEGGANTCTNDDQYPPTWEQNGFLFPSAKTCCDNFFPEECIVVEDCPVTTPTTTETPVTTTEATSEILPKCVATWHVNPDQPSSSCSNGADAPTSSWPDSMKGYESAEACCNGYYGEGNVCDIVDKCPNTQAPQKWWYHLNPSLPGGGECVENADYPDDWLSDFPDLLYTSYNECCGNHNDVSCILNVEKEEMWYNLNDSCIFGSDYPDWMGAGLNKWSYLFSSEEDCCLVYTCKDKEPKWWPKDNVEGTGFDCVFGNDYPVEFLDHGDNFLFDTEESCCALFCGDAVTTTTTTEAVTEAASVSLAPVSLAPTSSAPASSAPTTDAPTHAQTTDAPTTNPTESPSKTPSSKPTMIPTTSPSKTPVTTAPTVDPLNSSPFVDFVDGYDSFDDIDNSRPIPWNFGSPHQWVRDNTRKLTGSGSLRNILPEGSEASSTLGLKIRLTGYAVIKCSAYIETAMPYDRFIFEVNGVQRYASYFTTDDWVTVTSGLEPGETTIKFAVSKPKHFPPGERSKGSGYVWLDDCEIRKTGSKVL